MSKLDTQHRLALTQPDILVFASDATKALVEKYREAEKPRKQALARTYQTDYQVAFRITAREGFAFAPEWTKEIDAEVARTLAASRAAERALDAALLSDVDLWNGLAKAHAEAKARESAALIVYGEAKAARELYQAAGRTLRPMARLVPDPEPSVPALEPGWTTMGALTFDAPKPLVDDRDVFGRSTVDAPAVESTADGDEPALKQRKRSGSHPGFRDHDHYSDVV